MMTMGPWGLAILVIVVWGYGIQQGDWTLVSLVLAVGHVSRTKVTQFLVLSSCICFWVWVSFSLSQHYPVTVCVGGQPDLKWGNLFFWAGSLRNHNSLGRKSLVQLWVFTGQESTQPVPSSGRDGFSALAFQYLHLSREEHCSCLPVGDWICFNLVRDFWDKLTLHSAISASWGQRHVSHCKARVTLSDQASAIITHMNLDMAGPGVSSP